MEKVTASSWDQADEAGTASPARLILLASAAACKHTLHDGVRVRLGCFTNLHRLSARGPVPNVMLKLELQRWPRTSDACGLSPNGGIMAAPSRLPTLGTLLQEGVATAARADLTSSQLGIL